MLQQWFIFHWHLILLFLGFIAALIFWGLNYYVRASTDRFCYTDPAQVPLTEVAIVFGAGVWEDGTPCPMLSDRVQAGVELYKMGIAHKLLMTGDNSTPDYNEVKAMQLYAEKRAVPTQDIILDPAGFSTYESCDRAKEIFGVNRAILITQRYHLPRAIYTARQLGIEAVGLGIPDWGKYLSTSMFYYTLRERIATIKTLWDVHFIHPKSILIKPSEPSDR